MIAAASAPSEITTITRAAPAVRVTPNQFTAVSATTAAIATGRSHPLGAA